jgi:hypothetical protein
MSAHDLLEPEGRHFITFHSQSLVGYCHEYGVLFVDPQQDQRFDYYFGVVLNNRFQTLTNPLTRSSAKNGKVLLEGNIPCEDCKLTITIRVCKYGHLKFKGKKVYNSIWKSTLTQALHQKDEHCLYQEQLSLF